MVVATVVASVVSVVRRLVLRRLFPKMDLRQLVAAGGGVAEAVVVAGHTWIVALLPLPLLLLRPQQQPRHQEPVRQRPLLR